MDIELICNTCDAELFANVRENSARPLPWLKLKGVHNGHACLVGGGPSLIDHLPALRQRIAHGQQVFALNGAAKFLNDQGIVPDGQIILDARPQNLDLIGRAHTHYFASQVNPALYEHPKARNVVLWHHAGEGIDAHLPDYDDSYTLIGGAPSVGLAALCLTYALGFRFMHLFGYDSSHRADEGHAFAQPQNDRDPLCKVTVDGETFTSSLTMAGQAEKFPELCDALIDHGCTITIESDGLIAAVVQETKRANLKQLLATEG